MKFKPGDIIWNNDVNNPAGDAPSGKYIVISTEMADCGGGRWCLRAELIKESPGNSVTISGMKGFRWCLVPANCKLDFLYICKQVKKKEGRRAARNRK